MALVYCRINLDLWNLKAGFCIYHLMYISESEFIHAGKQLTCFLRWIQFISMSDIFCQEDAVISRTSISSMMYLFFSLTLHVFWCWLNHWLFPFTFRICLDLSALWLSSQMLLNRYMHYKELYKHANLEGCDVQLHRISSSKTGLLILKSGITFCCCCLQLYLLCMTVVLKWEREKKK